MKRDFKKMRVPEYPPSAISFETTLLNKTGSWRIFKPVYENKLPPCNNACPAFEDIQKYIYLALNKKYSEAYLTILEKNPFPSITGRVCAHPCEVACNRNEFDEPIGVHHIERFIGDYGLSQKSEVRRQKVSSLQRGNKFRIAIVGSGPAGMSCAYYLSKEGFSVDVFDKDAKPGGLLRMGIPEYRLPKEVLDKEIRKLERLGVKFFTNTTFGEDITLDELRRKYSAVFVAVGAQIERELEIPNEDAAGVLRGIEFLREVNKSHPALGAPLQGGDLKLGKKVLVIGGSFTAIDCARSAARLGRGREVTVIYRRTTNEMPASREEVEAAESEGVKFVFLTAPLKVLTNRNNEVKALECIKMKLGEPDASGRRRPIPVKGSNFRITADTIIKAVGESVELNEIPAAVEKTGWGVKASEWGETNLPGVYTAGDCVTGPRTVVEAIASGRRAAEKMIYDIKVKSDGAKTTQFNSTITRGEPVPYAKLNTFYFEEAPRQKMRERGRRFEGSKVKRFEEVNIGYNLSELSAEAARCFSCGVCNYCDNCYVYCPDLSVKKLTEGYEFVYDYCKGCGVCAAECPRDAITMYAE